MLPVDLPPQAQERLVCSISAAAAYQIPANLILAVAEKEGGRPGQWVRNTNGTHDVGPMQFNTSYLRELKSYGITPEHVAAAGCFSYRLAAWRLRQHLRYDKGDLWTRAANYHSRTPKFNAIYRADLMRRAAGWADWLAARYVTYDALDPGAGSAVPASARRATTAKSLSTNVATSSQAATLPLATIPDAAAPRLVASRQ